MSRLFLIAVLLAACLGPARGASRSAADHAFWESIAHRGKGKVRHERAVGRLAEVLTRRQFERLSRRYQDQLLEYTAMRQSGEPVLIRCWEDDTPGEVVDAFVAVETAGDTVADESALPLAQATQLGSRWSTTAASGSSQNVQGQPVTVTWSIVPDGTAIPSQPSVGDSSDPSNLRAWFAGIYDEDPATPMESQEWFAVFQAAFDSIAEKTGVTYVYEPNDDGAAFPNAAGSIGVRGDVRISAHRIDGNSGTLAYNFFPSTGDMVIDSTDSYFETLSNESRRLRNTVEHEMLHGLGVEHVCPTNQTKLMEPFINLGFTGMQYDDIYSVQRHYGDHLEKGDTSISNDAAAEAAPLSPVAGTPLTVQWVSLDGSEDTDWYAFEVTAGTAVTLRVDPGTDSYLEGPQNSSGSCTAGETFEAGAVRDLSLRLIDPDGSTVLVASESPGTGLVEETARYVVAGSGTYYAEVRGDATDGLQLYTLTIDVELPGPAPVVTSATILRESFVEPNGLLDPGETVEVSVVVENQGTVGAEDVEVSLAGSAGFTLFTPPRSVGELLAGETATARFVFGFSGEYGDPATLEVTAAEPGGNAFVRDFQYTLGSLGSSMAENFDAAASLPSGWSSVSTEGGTGWAVSGELADSPPNVVHAEPQSAVGTSILLSPSFVSDTNGSVFGFRHRMETQLGRDGGVLEISIDGGAWTDVTSSPVTFVEGGYTTTIGTGRANPLPLRQAWSGVSPGYIQTRLSLPASMSGQSVQFRWILGHDRFGFVGDGWRIDDVVFEPLVESSGVPEVTLALTGDTTNEGDDTDTVFFTVSAELPPIADLSVPLVFSGTADALTDVTGVLGIELPAGETTAESVIRAVLDNEVEGAESLTLALDPLADLVARDESSFTIQIGDSPYGNWAAVTVGVGGVTDPELDGDGDGFSNLEEHAWQTDGGDASSFPAATFTAVGGMLHLDAPVGLAPSDVTLVGETSTDLRIWTDAGVIEGADGFSVSQALVPGETVRFLRVRYVLDTPAP